MCVTCRVQTPPPHPGEEPSAETNQLILFLELASQGENAKALQVILSEPSKGGKKEAS